MAARGRQKRHPEQKVPRREPRFRMFPQRKPAQNLFGSQPVRLTLADQVDHLTQLPLCGPCTILVQNGLLLMGTRLPTHHATMTAGNTAVISN